MNGYISLVNRIGEKAHREALKSAQPLIENTDAFNRFVAEKVKDNFKEYIKRLDTSLTLAEDLGLKTVLEKHGFGMKKSAEMLVGKWFWITLRPSAEHQERFDSFKQQVFDYMKRKMFIGWKLAFEQKGETNEQMGTGYHVHILAECTNNMNKAKLIRDSKSSWKQWLGGDCPEAFIQVEKMEKKQEYQNRYKYITEQKGESYKHAAQAIDIIFRKTKNLNDIYSSE